MQIDLKERSIATPLHGQATPVFSNGSFADLMTLNAWTGQVAKWAWVVETWRAATLHSWQMPLRRRSAPAAA